MFLATSDLLSKVSDIQKEFKIGSTIPIQNARVVSIKKAEGIDGTVRYKMVLDLIDVDSKSGTDDMDDTDDSKLTHPSERIILTYIPSDSSRQPLMPTEAGISAMNDNSVEIEYIGLRISCNAMRKEILPAVNPNTFDYELYLKTQKIRVCAQTSEITVLPDFEQDIQSKVYHAIVKTKYSFETKIRTHMSKKDNADLLIAMLFGETDSLSSETYDTFKKSSTTHILSVSGIHVGMVYALVLLLCRGRRTVASSCFMIVLLLIYAALSEFCPSVMRALLMIVLSIIGRLRYRRYDILTSISLSMIILLLDNPLNAYHNGFQLSFLAVASLAFVMPWIDRFLHYRDKDTAAMIRNREAKKRLKLRTSEKVTMKIVEIVAPVAVIQVLMTPAVAYMFCGLSFTAIVANIPIIAISGIAVSCGVVAYIVSVLYDLLQYGLGTEFAAHLVGCVLDKILDILLYTESILIGTMDQIANLLARIPYGYIGVPAPNLTITLTGYLVTFFMISETWRMMYTDIRKKRQICLASGELDSGSGFGFGVFQKIRHLRAPISISICLLIFTVILTFSPNMPRQNKAALTFLDVGQGDCLHLRTPDNKNYLFDGGGQDSFNVGEKVLYEYLMHNGVSHLDGVFVSHLHMDHYKGIQELSKVMDIGEVYIYDGNKVKKEACVSGSGIAIEDLRFISQGDKLKLGKSVFVDVIYPEAQSDESYEDIMIHTDDENANSLVLKIDYAHISTLMTGDIDAELESKLVSMVNADDVDIDINIDILKVAHHGSKFSSSDDFLLAANPKIAVIQVGRYNMYGHPTKETLDRLKLHDILTYRNDYDGAVLIDIGKKIKIDTVIKK
ncbi:MAG: DNA internalization-related competence protein ComEC/Rec2 [Clostridiales Family XIII bacterium]|jgi:competence protein ComEC|nr:DNA internalization-related competence protein ComEC/Rec2 [Clostridiales Family XIII bacterium]